MFLYLLNRSDESRNEKKKVSSKRGRVLHGINVEDTLRKYFEISSLRFLRDRRCHFIGESTLRHKANGYQR